MHSVKFSKKFQFLSIHNDFYKPVSFLYRVSCKYGALLNTSSYLPVVNGSLSFGAFALSAEHFWYRTFGIWS